VSYDPLSHSRHNVGDRSTKVGHEIKTSPNISSSWTPADGHHEASRSCFH